MNRFIILLVLTSLFLFSATFPSSFYSDSDATSENISKNTSEKDTKNYSKEEKSENILLLLSQSEGEINKQQAKKKTKRKPFQTLQKLNQLRKALKESKKSYKENFPKIAKNKKDDGDCDIPANKLDWKVGLALACAIGMLVLPFLGGIVASVFISTSSGYVGISILQVIVSVLPFILSIIGLITGIGALKRYSYKNDCENYIANRKNRTVALIATIICGLLPLAFLLLLILLILTLSLGGF